MFIYHQQTGTKYYGPVTSLEDPQFHGKGKLINTPNQKSTRFYYEGDFNNGDRDGYGMERKKNYIYHGQWKKDLKDGIGVEYIQRNVKRNDKHPEKMMMEEEKVEMEMEEKPKNMKKK